MPNQTCSLPTEKSGSICGRCKAWLPVQPSRQRCKVEPPVTRGSRSRNPQTSILSHFKASRQASDCWESFESPRKRSPVHGMPLHEARIAIFIERVRMRCQRRKGGTGAASQQSHYAFFLDGGTGRSGGGSQGCTRSGRNTGRQVAAGPSARTNPKANRDAARTGRAWYTAVTRRLMGAAIRRLTPTNARNTERRIQ
jgi:hypothetical protein